MLLLPLEDESIVLALDCVVIDTKNWDVYGCSRKIEAFRHGCCQEHTKDTLDNDGRLF